MPFTTYENRSNPHVAIHKENCNQLRKRGGEHVNDQGKYEEHLTYKDALQYANSTELRVINCSFCDPTN
jgi:hypothetical protein